jgi:RNA polymerase sigma-70 factor (ECF subfamily)
MGENKKVTEEGFISSFDEYSDVLFRHAVFRLSDRERAKDVVQDTFMKTWKFISEGGVIDEYRSFLYRVLNNLIIDEYRKKKTSSLDEILESDHVQEGDFPELVDLSHKDTVRSIDAEKVYDLLTHVPDQYAQVVTMRFIDELSPKEIAIITGESENVISVRLHRALKALKRVATEKQFIYEG